MTDLPDTVVQVINSHLIVQKLEKDREVPSNAEDFEGETSSSGHPRGTGDARDNQVPHKDKDGKSRHKKRPRDERADKKDKLCQSLSSQSECVYGDKCQFSHDVKKYMASKPADIGERCYLYDTFGRCSLGLMCRFAGAHVRDNKNALRPEAEGGVLPQRKLNLLSKETQLLIRKKKWDELLPKPEVKKGDEGQPDFNFLPLDAKPRKLVDFSNKVYVAPLTTVGNLPFRRILRDFGADITCGEMALAQNLNNGQASEWALMRRHQSESTFGVQVAGGFSNDMEKLGALLEREIQTDFVDMNCGCPIDLVCNKGAGARLMTKRNRIVEIMEKMSRRLSCPMTVKMRTGWNDNEPLAGKVIELLQQSNAKHGRLAAIFVHGRSRQQRYARLADWEFIAEAAKAQDPTLPLIPVIGNGDILTWADWRSHQHLMQTALEDEHPDQLKLCNCAMIGRGALIKPWLPKEIHDQQAYDISASERLDMVKKFVNYGLEHWGSDQQGVDNTRRFLLEWLSYLCRYVPEGITSSPQTMIQKPPVYFGRSDTETLLASTESSDWIKISEMFLGPVTPGFAFEAKHKSNSYQTTAVNG